MIVRNMAQMQRLKSTLKITAMLLLGLLVAGCPTQKSGTNFGNFSGWGLPQQGNLWANMREHFMLVNDSNLSHIKFKIDWYTKRPEYLNRLADNARPYLYYVYQQTQIKHMPSEIALIPMVESNYNPFLFSHAGATGIWQLMPGTASGFGLKINWWYDGRRDIVASTKASLDYLNYLHDFFNNWLLAIAAYDSGEGTVQSALRYNRRHHLKTDFWSLPLPLETKRYVPKVLALAAIISDPTHYGIKLPEISNTPYFGEIDMKRQMDIRSIAKLADASVDSIRGLNPGFRRWATAPKTTYTLLLPRDKIALFRQHLANYKPNNVTWLHHIVKAGDSLSGIALHYHTSAPIIQRINHLKNNTIRIGQTLLIPESAHGRFANRVSASNASVQEDRLPGPQRIVHTVTAHDNLWTIAKFYGVKVSEIRFWNNLSYFGQLHVGEHLILWLQPRRVFVRGDYRYRVKSGDSLSRIAKLYHTTTTRIRSANGLRNDTIRLGESLKIPGYDHYVDARYYHRHAPAHHHRKTQAIHTAHKQTHRIKKGETLYDIARHYHVTVKDLILWNHLHDVRRLKPGRVLKV